MIPDRSSMREASIPVTLSIMGFVEAAGRILNDVHSLFTADTDGLSEARAIRQGGSDNMHRPSTSTSKGTAEAGIGLFLSTDISICPVEFLIKDESSLYSKVQTAIKNPSSHCSNESREACRRSCETFDVSA